MKIINKKIKDLIFAEYNPRKLTTEEYQNLKDSLVRFGIVDPVIINNNKNRKNILIGGHQRVRVWQDLGNKTIPVVEINLTYEKERELNIRLNKNTGSWDWDMMANEFDLDELKQWGFDEDDLFNFNFDRIDKLEEGEEIELPQSVQLEPPKEYILIMCDSNSEDWEQLKMDLQLRIVRRGGYKKGSAFDAVSMERVLTYKDFKKRYDNSNTE